jgi:DNA-directed RNA polymerase specialized sigma24 family protein
MTDTEATAAIEFLVEHRWWKLVRQANKYSGKYLDEVSDMIHEALMSAWENRAKIECMEAYVMGAVHFQAIGWFKRQRNKETSWSPTRRYELGSLHRSDLSERSSNGFMRRALDNGDDRSAMAQWHESQRMEDLHSTIDACADMLGPFMKQNFNDLVAREGENGGNHSVECRDSRVRLSMREKRDALESRQKVRRAAA